MWSVFHYSYQSVKILFLVKNILSFLTTVAHNINKDLQDLSFKLPCNALQIALAEPYPSIVYSRCADCMVRIICPLFIATGCHLTYYMPTGGSVLDLDCFFFLCRFIGIEQ